MAEKSSRIDVLLSCWTIVIFLLGYSRSALHWAALQGHKDTTESLIHHGADIEAEDKLAKTPLSLATEAGHYDIVDLLREHGAEEAPLSSLFQLL